MREIHNLVEHGETATRSTLGGHSHARGEYLYALYFFIFLYICEYLDTLIVIFFHLGEYLYFSFNFVFLYILVTHSSIPMQEVRQPPTIACTIVSSYSQIVVFSENNVDQAGGERGRRRTREENNINNNMDSSRKSR